MRALKGTEVASPSWHRSSLAADKFWRRFGNTHYLHIFQYFLALPGTCDEFSFNSLHAHLAEKCEKALRFKIFRETKGGDSEAPGWGAKKVTTQSGHSRAPKAFATNRYFPDRFCIFCSSGSIWLPVPAHPSCSKWIKKHYVWRHFENSRGAILKPQDGDTKKWSSKVDAKEPPRHLRKTVIFLMYFAFFALRIQFGRRSRCALHFQNRQKDIDFITFRTPRLGPTWGTKRNVQNRKMSATLHGSAPVQNETSATLHGNAFCIRMVQMTPPKRVPKKCPKHLFLNPFECFLDPSDGGMAPRRHRAKRAPRCMGAQFLQKHDKFHGFVNKDDALNGTILRPQDQGDKKMTTRSGCQRAPKAFSKNRHFPCIFCIFCSSGSIWWPLLARPAFSK